MARGMERDDLPIAARDEQRVGWIDRKAVPDHLLREYRVGHAFERPDLAAQRRQDLQLSHRASSLFDYHQDSSCTPNAPLVYSIRVRANGPSSNRGPAKPARTGRT